MTFPDKHLTPTWLWSEYLNTTEWYKILTIFATKIITPSAKYSVFSIIMTEFRKG